MGARSNQDDPSVGSNVGDELKIMLNPVPLLSSLVFSPAGRSEVAGGRPLEHAGLPVHKTRTAPGRSNCMSSAAARMCTSSRSIKNGAFC